MPGGTLYLVLAPLLLLWALVAARRSGFDALLLGLAGLILAYKLFERQILAALGLSPMGFGILPELALVPIGFLMLVRVFFSRMGGLHRFGLGAIGCLLMIPALLIAGWISLWMFGSSASRPPQQRTPEANASAPADPAANQAAPQ